MNSRNTSSDEQKAHFENLKSDYFLRKLFDILNKNKTLNIVKYNKNLQKRLYISINDYRECSEIEIELKLDKNKVGKYKFINIPKEDKEYYHIFFDNSNEEIKRKRNYLKQNEKVKMIKIIIDYPVKSFKELFFDCDCIESIFFKKFYRSNITNMSYMFSGCSSLKELNLSSFNTNNVIDMCGMFSRCLSLKELNLSNFNTNNVNNMSRMFSACSSLKELNLSNFNTNKVTDMRWMFSFCSKLKELNLSNFNTNNITDMTDMLFGCSKELKNKIKDQNKNIFI
jgi:surface protein